MNRILIGSLVLVAFFAGCDSDCCSDVQVTPQGNNTPIDNKPSGNEVFVAPRVNLAVPESDLNRQSNTQLVLDGADYSSDEDGTVTNYQWTFKKPDGTVSNYTEQKPTFTFPSVGVYEICLKVKDDDNQVSNQSCRNVVVEDQPVYLKPEPIVTVLDPATKQPLPSQDRLILQPGQNVIFSATDSYDPDNLDSNKITAYHWKMIEYRHYPDGYTFKYHYCNWKNMPNGEPDQPDHSGCSAQIADSNGVPYAQIPYTIHAGASPEIHRTVELCVEDQDFLDGKNDYNCRTYEYDSTLYNNEDLTKIPEHPIHKPTL